MQLSIDQVRDTLSFRSSDGALPGFEPNPPDCSGCKDRGIKLLHHSTFNMWNGEWCDNSNPFSHPFVCIIMVFIFLQDLHPCIVLRVSTSFQKIY